MDHVHHSSFHTRRGSLSSVICSKSSLHAKRISHATTPSLTPAPLSSAQYFAQQKALYFEAFCVDIDKRARKDFAIEFNPIATRMAETLSPGRFPKYHCKTQEDDEPSFGNVPVSNLAGTTGENAPDQPDSLVLGYGKIVPRWDTTPQGGSNLLYYVQKAGFPSSQEALIATSLFQKAANRWNQLQLGVTISEIPDAGKASFYLIYKPNPSAGDDRFTLASAFFPHQRGRDVVVYQYGLQPEYHSILDNVFCHEIGHILGLRHEFAIKKAESANPVQFMEMNDDSIMSYNMPPEIQDSDIEQVIKFYKLPNGYLINASPVTDYQPAIRQMFK